MAEAKWFSHVYRRNLVDMHIEDWNDEFLSRFDPATYVDLMKRAHVQMAMIYANSHVGHCYWPTASGHQHEVLGGRDIFGETVKLCVEAGIKVVPYYSLIYNNWEYEKHPEWRIRNRAGLASREAGGPAGFLSRRYGVVCPNNEEYRDFVQTQIGEICERYEFDGMFFDMNFWPDVCYCDSCRKRYDKEIGGEIPTVVDWNDPTWTRFQKKREEWIAEFGLFASSVARELKPGVSSEHNSAALIGQWSGANTLSMLKANDYTGGDLYGGTLSQSFICKFFLGVTPFMPFEYMVPRCYPTLRDHTTSKSYDMLKQQGFYALAHNGAFLFIDAIDPSGELDPRIYERVGAIFKEHAGYEPYLGGELVADVAIYHSLDSKMDPTVNGGEVGRPSGDLFGGTPHFTAALGATKTLKERHVPFTVISTNRLDELLRYKTVIVPSLAAASQAEVSAFTAYVKEGGCLYVSGMGGKLFESLLGIRIDDRTPESVSYISPTDAGEALFPESSTKSPLGIYEPQWRADLSGDVEVLATITFPYTDPSDIPNDQIVQFPRSPEVITERFASIHSNPPGRPTDLPALIRRKVGKGVVVWASAPIETPDKYAHQQTFHQILSSLTPGSMSWSADAPAAIEVIVFHQESKNRYLVNAVNTQELWPMTAAHGVTVRLPVRRDVSSVQLLPDRGDLPFEQEQGTVEFTFPPVQVGQMVLVNYR